MNTPKEWLRRMIAEQEAARQAALVSGNKTALATAERELANYRRMLGSS
ncbi:Uncharacterised protein [Eikenella corrodens]|uniref:Uncharacterized protein n=2 Tax=Eikenella corrodens TaxID=539 RepID=C0DT90_EIKCO|nr:hypothetical protein [Eikenella corrodens]EEG24795.1 hypothetical protein EIKCOROL_00568 [Eikenella corrodens ATCC 23834]UAK75549.1 hypothetical protein K8P00_03095 [Eikenella corrodens]SNW07174.1 Uncharacterised protein [Eikenella corrodens]